MDWRATWRGPAAGVLVFALWMGLERAMGGWPVASAPAAWLNSGGMARWGWLAFRLAGAVIAVPLAEELAFRGYLIRRLVAEEFDKLPRYRFTTWGLVVSSLLFGAMHGSRWLAGTLAGLVYALIFVRRGRLGEAVVAHAVTNALIAAAVLGLGWWKLW
jgi:CAAX prenyl protease-like protein